jgi:Domain of unknown function (DUF4365)
MHRIEAHPDWLVRDLSEDYGVDFEAELTDHGPRGEILKIQVKTTRRVVRDSGLIKVTVARKYFEYAHVSRYPMIYVLVDLGSEEAWFIWLQDWLLENRSSIKLRSQQSSWVAWIDDRDTLDCGLNSVFKTIARWQGETQLILSLMDALRCAAATQNLATVEALEEILSDNAPAISDARLAAVIDEVVSLGDRARGTGEGNTVATQLFAIIKRLGGKISREVLHDLVIRKVPGDSYTYSRTGLTALDILYTEYPSHMKSMRLPEYFSQYDPRVAYFCALREAFPQKNTLWYFNPPQSSFEFAGLHFVASDRFRDKCASRGPSAILDDLEYR